MSRSRRLQLRLYTQLHSKVSIAKSCAREEALTWSGTVPRAMEGNPWKKRLSEKQSEKPSNYQEQTYHPSVPLLLNLISRGAYVASALTTIAVESLNDTMIDPFKDSA